MTIYRFEDFRESYCSRELACQRSQVAHAYPVRTWLFVEEIDDVNFVDRKACFFLVVVRKSILEFTLQVRGPSLSRPFVHPLQTFRLRNC